jgi:hypothetical protein
MISVAGSGSGACGANVANFLGEYYLCYVDKDTICLGLKPSAENVAASRHLQKHGERGYGMNITGPIRKLGFGPSFRERVETSQKDGMLIIDLSPYKDQRINDH